MAFVADGERFGIVAAAAADFAQDVNVRKKIHLDATEAVALAGFAAAALHVEAEAAGAVAALARFGKHGEEIADRSEDAGVSCGIRSRRAADGSLIDFDNFVDLVGAENFTMGGGWFVGAVELLCERAIKNVVDERGFAGAGNAGDDDEHAERQRDINFLEIVRAGTEDLDGFAVEAAALFGDGDSCRAAEILPGERFGSGFDLLRLAVGDEVAAGVARAGAEVDDEIGATDGVLVVLDDENGVAEIAKMFERAKKARVVAGVEPNAGFIENVENAAKARSDFFLALDEPRENFADGGARGAERERSEIGDGPAGELDRERFRAEALA